jgi:2-(1,2-epoxy-1,2-dihydrophenyl)acetyl-CoA isomerase
MRRMPAPLPELEAIRLRRGASNGAELRIELARPERMNAWDAQLGADLLAAVRLAAADDEVRVVTITGAGRAFSAGADLRAGFERTAAGHPDVGTALRERYHPIITTVRRMPKPVVAAVNGPAVGIGCSLTLACDLVVAAESAYLLLAFVNIGLVPDGAPPCSSPPAPAAAGRWRWRCWASASRRGARSSGVSSPR